MIKLDQVKKKDRRHDRYQLSGSATVMQPVPRLGGLLKPKWIELGPIIDVSYGGLAFQYVEKEEQQTELNELTINVPPDKRVLEGIPVQTVSDVVVSEVPTMGKIRRQGLKFGEMSQKQKISLVKFLQNYTRRLQTPSKK